MKSRHGFVRRLDSPQLGYVDKTERRSSNRDRTSLEAPQSAFGSAEYLSEQTQDTFRMPSTFIVSNVPAGTTPDELLAHWQKTGAPILSIEPVEGRDPDDLVFKVKIDVDTKTLKMMADRFRGSLFKGRQLRSYVLTQHS